MKIKLALFALLLAALALNACAPDQQQAIADALGTAFAETQQISDLQTQAAGGGQNAATETPVPTQAEATVDQGTATDAATPTSSTPFVSVSVDTNCRTGPRLDYAYVTTVLVGEKLEVVGTYPNADYVIVRLSSGKTCWLWLRYASPTDFSAYNLQVYTQPPTSTPTRTPTNTPTLTFTPTPSPTP